MMKTLQPFRGLSLYTVLTLFIIHANLWLVSSFVVRKNGGRLVATATISRRTFTTAIRASTSKTEAQVDQLLELVNAPEEERETNAQEIQTIVYSLAEEQAPVEDTSITNFTALLGNYNVSHVIPSKPNEKPVGGKWSRGPAQTLAKTRRTLQHLLAPKRNGAVAEAVNVISLAALRDSFRINVILRGDAFELSTKERDDIVQERQTPGGLSSRAVRADFDPPRIVVSRHNSSLLSLRVGPPSSVVLDTPYCDDRIRIGKGSRGSWFVFSRCNDDEADEWKRWIAVRPVRKAKALAVLLSTFGVGIVGYNAKGLWRVGGVALSTVSLLAGALVGFSTGGIERDDDDNETLAQGD